MIIIEEVVQELAMNPEEILKFAYELRKQDTDDLYSLNILDGQLKP